MAISSYEGVQLKLELSPGRLKYEKLGESSSTASPSRSKSHKMRCAKSPYLADNKVNLISRETEKKFVHKKNVNAITPLASSVYTVNSDEFKPKRKMKKNKKSVLTLPNEPAPKPQECTVSDMNESDYFNKEEHQKAKTKKRFPIYKPQQGDVKEHNKRSNNLDSSSTDLSKTSQCKALKPARKSQISKPKGEVKTNAHDVWSMLKKMNWFHHRPSPPMSEESEQIKPSKKTIKRKHLTKDGRIFKTQESEEFTFIKLNSIYGSSCSPASSFDRITVINAKDDLHQIYDNFEKQVSYDKHLENPNKSYRQKIPFKKFKLNENSAALENRTCIAQNKIKSNFKACTSVKDNNVNGGGIEINNSENYNKHNPFPNHKSMKLCSNNKSNIDTIKTLNVINSGSSKAGYINSDYFKADEEQIINLNNKQRKLKLKKNLNVLENESGGICNTQIQSDKKLHSMNRKPRLVTTMPSSNILTRPCETGKQRLDVKFPIIFIGQDAHGSSSVLEINEGNPLLNSIYEPKQIENGMKVTNKGILRKKDKKIGTMPFDGQRKALLTSTILHDRNIYFKLTSQHLKTAEQGTNTCIDKNIISKKTLTDTLIIDKQCKPHNIEKNINFVKKSRCSNSSLKRSLFVNKIHSDNWTKTKTEKIKNIYKETIHPSSKTNSATRIVSINASEELSKRKLKNTKLSWAKVRWISDFIDNVINKTLTGIYHSNDSANSANQSFASRKLNKRNPKKVTTLSEYQKEKKDPGIGNDLLDSLVASEKALKTIGTGDALKSIEIDSFFTNKIAIKDMKSNIIVHFDINISLYPDMVDRDYNQSLVCEPILQENKINNFKCKTTIVNSMLPAEICSLVPEIMRVIMEAKSKSHSFLPLPIPSTDLIGASNEICQYDFQQPMVRCIPLQPYVLKWSKGAFKKITKSQERVFPYYEHHSWHFREISWLLPKNLWNEWIMNPRNDILEQQLTKHSVSLPKPVLYQTSNAIQPVDNTNNIIRSTCGHQDFHNLINNSKEDFPWNCSITLHKSIRDVKIDVRMTNNCGTTMFISLSKEPCWFSQNILSTENVMAKYKCMLGNIHKKVDDFQFKCLEYTDKSQTEKVFANRSSQRRTKIRYRSKKNKNIQSNRKSKSTTNISEEKRHFTISTIQNLADFLQTLGSANKFIASVFEGCSEMKILSCLKEMEIWVKEINSKQAILILLFANKKETPVLKRYQSIILQGIAVKRITRAIELDMEIEVLEKEMPKLSKFDALSFFPSAFEKQNGLFEELLWIAKTTASDYQKPFNEASVKLLKSLLQKRKKSNPSYLRVMARYVGLGLLKPLK